MKKRLLTMAAFTVTLTAVLLGGVFVFRWAWASRYALLRAGWSAFEDLRFFASREWDSGAALYLALGIGGLALFGGLLSWAGRRTWDLQNRASLLRRVLRRTRTLTETDLLTGLYTRRSVMAHLEGEIKAWARHKRVFSTLFVDVDHFKSINDSLGHLVGDDVLKTIATAIRTSVRESDVAGRYGGDEFIILLPDTDADNACRVAERVRRAVQNLFYQRKDMKIKPTISLGVMVYRTAMGNLRDFINAADQALLQSKKLGKNRTILCENPGLFRTIESPTG